MKRAVIWISAPPAPRCFSTRQQWVEYLAEAQASRKSDRRPFIGEQYRPTFSFCADCAAAHRAQMQAENSCGFDGYVAVARAHVERAAAATQKDPINAAAT